MLFSVVDHLAKTSFAVDFHVHSILYIEAIE